MAVRDAALPGPVRFTSFEAYPLSADDMRTALAAFPELGDDAAWLVSEWRNGPCFRNEWMEIEVVLGDAREMLPSWSGRADAWFLDGFAPARNAELWDRDLLRAVADHTVPGGTVATYSAAGAVRRGLEDAGFEVRRIPGFGRKRHMTVGRLS